MANVKFYTGSLDKMQSANAPNIQIGHVYFAVDTSSTSPKGDIYFDANDTTRIKMGAHSDYALKAEGDANPIKKTYLIKAKGTISAIDYQVITYRGDSAAIDEDGNVIDDNNPKKCTLKIEGATTTAAGLVTTGTQTWTGAKTLDGSGSLTITKANGFNYSGIEAATGDAYRPIWYSRSDAVGTPCVDNKTIASSTFKYNPSTGALWVKEIRNNTTDNNSTTRLYGTATKVSNSLTFGTGSASKIYDGSNAVNVTAADLGLASALKFIGFADDDGDTSFTVANAGDSSKEISGATVKISGQNHSPEVGDTVIQGKLEYVCSKVETNTSGAITKSKWQLLGDESSYELKGVAQNLINGLDATKTAAAGNFISGITQTNGVITAIGETAINTTLTHTAGTANDASKLKVTVGGKESSTIELTKATTGVYGVTKLYNGVDSTETGLAATANAVKVAYDKACAIDNLNNDNAADDSKYVSNVTQSNGLITVSMSSFSPTVTIGAGTGSAAPTVNISVGGNSATAQSITTASTSVYGVTKLTSTINTSEVLAATPKAVKTVKDIADAAMPKAGGTFTGAVTFSAGMTLAKDKIFSVQGGQIKLQSGSSSHSKDEGASIVTAGGISVAETLSAGKVRIDDGLGNQTSIGHGCEMIYNASQACLEFTFN